MKTLMAAMAGTSSYDLSSSSASSSSPGHFHMLKKPPKEEEVEEEELEEVVAERRNIKVALVGQVLLDPAAATSTTNKRSSSAAVSRLRSVLMAAIPGRSSRPPGLGSRVVGTIFGHRCGHVHLAFQADARSCPVVLIELSTPTAALVREMSSGVVRIALECERSTSGGGEKGPAAPSRPCCRLVEETLWRAYCNGNNLGYAVRRECGTADWKVLRAVEPVSMGAGVIPGDSGGGGSGSCSSSSSSATVGANSDMDIMYMRARFERVVGSKDSEALYMMSPDANGSPELSVYFLRV